MPLLFRAELPSCHHWHTQVKQNQTRMGVLPQVGKRLYAICHTRNTIAFVLKNLSEYGTNGRLIFDNQNRHRNVLAALVRGVLRVKGKNRATKRQRTITS
jgi:hypothetical protein